jgi:hypothetical protein
MSSTTAVPVAAQVSHDFNTEVTASNHSFIDDKACADQARAEQTFSTLFEKLLTGTKPKSKIAKFLGAGKKATIADMEDVISQLKELAYKLTSLQVHKNNKITYKSKELSFVRLWICFRPYYNPEPHF